MDSEYKCTLNDFFLKKAKDELHEDPKNRLGAVQTFRDWLNAQKHIRCLKDTHTLLKFLRVAKFSQLVARQFLTNYVTLCEKWPRYFNNIDMADPKIQAFLDSGYMVLSPKLDEHGRQLMICRMSALDPDFKTYDKEAIYKAMMGVFAYYMSIEENQVSGFTYFIDLTGFTLAQSKVWTLDDMKLSGVMWNKCFPARFKEFHYYNHGPVFEALFDIFKTFLSKKMKDRVRFHGSNMEAIYKVISTEHLPDEYLPDDHKGPSAGPLQNLIDDLKNQMLKPDIRERILYETDPKHLGIDLTVASATDAPQESFRRLNID